MKKGLSGNFWLVSFKISYLCLPLFYETRTTPSCHPSGCGISFVSATDRLRMWK